jgi:transposase InsO family protein
MSNAPDGDGAEERMRRQDEAIGNMMREINRLQQMLANQQAVMAAAGVIDAQGNPVQGGGQAGLAQVLNALLERMGGGLGDGLAMPLHANSGIGALSSFKTDSVKIMKFGGKNYHLWRWNAERQMELMGVWKLVKGEELMPIVATDKQIQENGGVLPEGCAKPDGTPYVEEDVILFKRKNLMAETYLGSALEYTYLQEVTGCGSAREMFEKLDNTYQQVSITNQLRLKTEFYSFQQKKGQSVDMLIKALDALVDRLQGIGVIIEDQDRVISLLKALHPDYEMMKNILLEREGLTYRDACSKLLAHVQLNGKANTFSDEKKLAYQAGLKDGLKKDKKPSYGGKISGGKEPKANVAARAYCYTCGDAGHISLSCPLRAKPGEKQPTYCYVCKNAGHIAPNCPSRAESSEQGAKRVNLAEVWEANVASVVVAPAAMMAEDGKRRKESVWIVDSGATDHMCRDRIAFVTLGEVTSEKTILLGDSHPIPVEREGPVQVHTNVEDNIRTLELEDVLYTPKMTKNLFSVSAWLKTPNSSVNFDGQEGLIMRDGVVWAVAHQENKLWVLDTLSYPMALVTSAESNGEDIRLWHMRFGHLNEEDMRKLPNVVHGLEKGFKGIIQGRCQGCPLGKQHRVSFPKERQQGGMVDLLDLVHGDVVGPINPESIGGKKYILAITDDKSRMSWVYLMRRKEETFSHFVEWVKLVERQSGKKVKSFRSDNGGEFTSGEFKSFFGDYGIEHQFTIPDSPQQNGVAERYNRTLIEMARTMIHSAGLAMKFWGEAVMAANYTRNRCPTSTVEGNVTPYEIWHGRRPNIRHLRTFGCRVDIHIPAHQRSKMQPKSKKGIFMGYAPAQKAYRVWDFNKRDVVSSRDVIFREEGLLKLILGETMQEEEPIPLPQEESEEELEVETPTPAQEEPELTNIEGENSSHESEEYTSMPLRSQDPFRRNGAQFTQMTSGLIPTDVHISGDEEANGEENLGPIGEGNQPEPHGVPTTPNLEGGSSQNHEEESESDQEEVIVPRRSERTRHRPQFLTYETLGTPKESTTFHAACNHAIVKEPGSLQEALSCDDSKEWIKAVEDEFFSLIKNGTWELVKLPAGRKPITAKWLFKLKPLPEGGFKYKARFVARGFSQMEGVDYKETFAPVVRYSSLRTLLAVANERKMHIHQMDVKTAFLHGELEEEIYLVQPEGLEVPGQEHLVCKLKKSLYGLKQSPRCWNTKLNGFLEEQGFKRCISDPSIYWKKSGKEQIYVAVYVDDLLIMSENLEEVNKVKADLSSRFEMVDFGEANVVLGIRIRRDKKQGILTLDQEKYVVDVLERFNMGECKGVDTPISTGVILSKEQCPTNEEERRAMQGIPYRAIIGSLMYLMVSTRPDIAAAVGMLSRFLENPGRSHYEAAKRVLRYISKTRNMGLVFFNHGVIEVSGYSDSDWGGCVDTRRSTTGYVYTLGGGAISWNSKRQNTVALSSCEAEYVAAAQAAKEALWLRSLLGEIGVLQEWPIAIRTDSQSALGLMKNVGYTARSKHVDIQLHFVRETIVKEFLQFTYVNTEMQVADSLTKAVSKDKVEYCRKHMGVHALMEHMFMVDRV